ncbi:MAG: energy-coupling factor transporter transmembrane component T [Lachnospiraceae bacterium]|nr:energy-coupling factor transporter transmembrane component T [Lachnospiraceae bacterium]
MENIDSFAGYHPIVNLAYFVIVIAIAMFSMHPVIICISLIMSLVYLTYLTGIKKVIGRLKLLVTMTIMIIVINPLFNHEGMTILGYFKTGNPLTLESIIYGIFMALLMMSVILWFAIYNVIMTSDKFIYIFGRIIPHLSLIISMSLRYVPRFKEQFIRVREARRCMGRDINQGNVFIRIRNLAAILSIMITWSLENSIETADSMKSRGYGLPGRTAFSIYKFHKRDSIALTAMSVCTMAFIWLVTNDKMYYRYYPVFERNLANIWSVMAYALFVIICSIPMLIDICDSYRFKRTEINVH